MKLVNVGPAVAFMFVGARIAVAASMAVVLMAAAGCSATNSSITIKSPSLSSPSVSVSDDGRVWDPNAWVPPVKVELPKISDAERMSKRAEWLKTLAPKDVKAPEVNLVRWTVPGAERGETMTKCLVDSGFPANFDGVDAWYFNPPVPESQSEALTLASYVCESKYTMDPVYISTYTEDQLRVMYDYWTQYYVPCVRAHGIPYDDSNKPTREVFVSTFYSDPGKRWFAYEATNSLPSTRRATIVKTCPEMPPNKDLYGG